MLRAKRAEFFSTVVPHVTLATITCFVPVFYTEQYSERDNVNSGYEQQGRATDYRVFM